MTTFAIVRTAACDPSVTAAWLSALALDLAVQLQRDLAPAWGLDPRSLNVDPTVYATPGETPAGSYVLEFIGAMPVGEEADAAYHTEDADGRVRAPIATIAMGEAVALDEVSQAASHEALEATKNPRINTWVDFGDARPGWSTMLEVCDACESTGYRVRAGGPLLSGFLFPSFFDPYGVAPFDYLGNVSAPFTKLPGGAGDYMIVRDPQGVRSQEPAGAVLGRRATLALALALRADLARLTGGAA